MAILSNSRLGLGGDETTLCRHAAPGEIHMALAMILGSPGRPAAASQVADFVNVSAQRRIDVSAIWVAQTGQRIVWAVLPVLNPGRTCLLLSPPEILDATLPAATRLVNEICLDLARRQVHLSQVLLEPQYARPRRLFTTLGFMEIAELIYLQGYVPRNIQPATLTDQMRWIPYSPQNHALYSRAIVETYRDSLDCPALSGLREIDDVIAGHQATGEFDPAAWQLLLENERPVGVVLLSRITNTEISELVYLGLAPEARNRGFGSLLMRHALHTTSRENRRKISLAVDSRNAPALKLYYRFGLQQVATRFAMIRDLRTPAGT
jgi:ribosomal protein S18 acetylase RimI-like enzyme